MIRLNIIALAAYVIMSGACKSARAPQHTTLNNDVYKEEFKGFRLLPSSAKNIYAGATWVKATGTLQTKDSVEKTQVALLPFTFSNRDDSFIIAAKIQLLYFLGICVTAATLRNYHLSVDSAVIEHLTGIDEPDIVEDGIYVWDVIRVHNISLDVGKEEADSLVNIINLLPHAAIIKRSSNDGHTRLVLHGLHQPIAYRLARLSNKIVVISNDLRLEQATRFRTGEGNTAYIKSFTIGKRYTGRIFKTASYINRHYQDESAFKKEQYNHQIWPQMRLQNNCVAVMEIQCNQDTVGGNPRKIKVMLGCEEDGSNAVALPVKNITAFIPLVDDMQGNYYLHEALEINRLVFLPGLQYPESGPSYGIPGLVHTRTSFRIQYVEDPQAEDW